VLFRRLADNGCRFIAVDSAVVHEHLLPSRTTARWLLERRFLRGLQGERVDHATCAGRLPRGARIRLLASAVRWGVLGAVTFPVSRIHGLDRLIQAALDLGRFAFHSGFSYRPYSRDSWR
jgi:hypothetical protein